MKTILKMWYGIAFLAFGLAVLLTPIVKEYYSPPKMAFIHKEMPVPPPPPSMSRPKSGKSVDVVAPPSVGSPLPRMASVPERDWTWYMDKIVGWISTIVGLWVIIEKTRRRENV